MGTNKYVLAKDEDFDFKRDGYVTYVGKEPYVEIPHIIKGKPVTSIDYMFECNTTTRGIKSTNKDIQSINYAFYDCKRDELDLSEFDATSVKDANGAFNEATIKNVIFPKTGFPKLKDGEHMFYASNIEKLDFSQLNLSAIKKAQCMFLMATIDILMLPTDGSFAPDNAKFIFEELKTNILDLTNFNTNNLLDAYYAFNEMRSRKIIWPTTSLDKLLESDPDDEYFPLEYIPSNSQTEEICWMSVLNDKRQGEFVKVKSKKILMYLGDEYPEYIDFYYNN